MVSQQAILEMLNHRSKDGASVTSISNRLQGNPNSVRVILERLRTQGRVRRAAVTLKSPRKGREYIYFINGMGQKRLAYLRSQKVD